MKIVQTPARFFPSIGGVQKYVSDLSFQLLDQGHQVTVICADEPHSDSIWVGNIKVVRLPYLFKIANTNITISLLWRLMKEEFDLIHTHFPTPWSAEISLICAKIKKKPCVLTYHNDVDKSGLLGLFSELYNRTSLFLLLANVDKILITQPRYVKDSRFLDRYKNKITIITNGVNELPPINKQKQENSTLLFVGVLDQHHRYKGLEYLIESVTILKDKWPDIRLEIVGQGELVDEYRELTVKLNLEDRIYFYGYVDDQKLSEIYQKCSIFVLPSIDLHEGFGIVLIEAMARSLPVITTDVVGLSEEIRNHHTGCVIPPKDPSAIAAAVNLLLSDPQKARKFGENGRNLIKQKYLWKDISRNLVNIYEELLR